MKLRRRSASLVVKLSLTCLLLLCIATFAFAQDAAVINGSSWLKTQQNPDGSWGDLSRLRDTTTVLDTYKFLGESGAFYQSAVGWTGGVSIESNDYIARRVVSLFGTGADVVPQIQRLISYQNPDGGWGYLQGYGSNPYDTATVLNALRGVGFQDVSSLSKAISYLLSKQNADGSWSFLANAAGDVATTAPVLIALRNDADPTTAAAAIDKGTVWLKTKQNPDGGFGSSPSTISDTVFALMALAETGRLQAVLVDSAVNYLSTTQNPDGSWNQDPYETAVAVRTLAGLRPNLSIALVDLQVPTRIKSGELVRVTITVRNLGFKTADNIPVQILVETPSHEVVQLGPTQTIPTLPVGSSATVQVDFDTQGKQGSYGIFVKADPDNTIVELTEVDNQTTKPVSIVPVPDLVMTDANITVAPNPARIGEDVAITATVSNQGIAPAINVNIAYYYDAISSATLIGTSVIPLLEPGQTDSRQVIWKANKVGPNIPLYVVVDPQIKIEELTRSNNQGSKQIEIASVTEPNLTVSYQDISFTPTVAAQGGSVEISSLIKNEGFSTANSVEVQFYSGLPGAGGVLLGSQTIPSIAPGASATSLFHWADIPESGERIVYVKVDPSNNIQEFDEEDNEAFTTLRILTLPDLSLSNNSISFTPPAPKEGDIVSIQVTVQNSGEQSASVVPVRAYEGSTLIGSEVIASIPGHSQGSASFQYNTAAKTGSHLITVAVDPDNSIPEQSKQNNRAARTFGVQNANLWLTEAAISPNGDGVKESTQFFFRLAASETVRVVISNEKGKAVRTFSGSDLENITAGNITWDGLDDQGRVVGDGVHQIEIQDASGRSIGGLPIVVDTNRSPLIKALGTPYLLNQNITCGPLGFSNTIWKWFPDESGFLINISYPDRSIPEYPTGLYSVSTDGVDIQRLIPMEWSQGTDPTYDYYIIDNDLSPDGEKVAFSLSKHDKIRFRGVSSQLWVVDRDGTNLTLIESYDDQQIFFPSFRDLKWSPDNRSIAYTFNNGLWVIKADGTGKTKIDEGGSFDELNWTPDSQKLVYSFSPDIFSVERITRSDLSGNKQLLMGTEGFINFLTIINQAQVLVGEYDPETEADRVWLIDENGEKKRFDTYEVSTAPNRQAFAFVTGTQTEGTIQISDLQGNVSSIEVLRSTEPFSVLSVGNLLWSPDSARIAFTYQSVCSGEGLCPTFDLSPLRLVLIDIKTREQVSFEPRFDSNDFTDNTFSLVRWLSDGSIFGKTYGNYYLIDSGTGEVFPVIPSGGATFDERASGGRERPLSPHERYLIYFRNVDPLSSCDQRAYFDVWAISSLLNLTADLRAVKGGSAVVLSGVAADLNFESYQLEYADIKQPDVWNLIAPPSDTPVSNGVMTTWVPPHEGTFYVRLSVSDRAGNVATSRKRISWGLSASITNLYKTLDLFSPNGDGVKDTVELHYKVLEPVHLNATVLDENDRPVKTFARNYTAPTDDFIAWDGRDGSGHLVPEGKYSFKVFDYQFFMEIDVTSPEVGVKWGAPKIAKVDCADPRGLNPPFFRQILAHSLDAHLKQWQIEVFDPRSSNAEWEWVTTGNHPLGSKDPETGDIREAGVGRCLYMEEVTGKQYRIIAEDLAGNRSAAIFTSPELIIIDIFDITSVKDSSNHVLTLRVGESVIRPVDRVTLQYTRTSDWLNDIRTGNWLDGPVIHNESNRISEYFPFDWNHLAITVLPVAARLKVIDDTGAEFYSGWIALHGDGDGIALTKIDPPSQEDLNHYRFQGAHSIRGQGGVLQLQIAPAKTSNWKTIYTQSLPAPGLFEVKIDKSLLEPCKLYEARFVVVMPGGTVRESNDQEFAAPCLLLSSVSVDSLQCNTASEKVKISAVPILVGYELQELIIHVQSPNGSAVDLLRVAQPILGREYSTVFYHTSLPTGSQQLVGILKYKKVDPVTGAVSLSELTAVETLLIDRTLPTGRITYPVHTQKLCPTTVPAPEGDWLAVPIEGIVSDDSGAIKKYRLFYGFGENPATWLPAMTRKGKNKTQISGSGQIQGQLGLWDITDLRGTVSLKLETVDAAGNLSCHIIVVHIDRLIEISGTTADKKLFSPNGDGIVDDVKVDYVIDEEATVDVKVFRLIPAGSSYIPDPASVKTVLSGIRHLPGLGSAIWDGRDDSGAVVPDGRYRISVFAKDLCGNVAEKSVDVEVDHTPPTASITYPRPSDPLGNIVETRGTSEDLHFKSYILEVGSGELPATWASVASGTNPVRESLIGQWNTFGLDGRWTLRLTATDTVGNRNVSSVTIDLGARKTLIKDAGVTPQLFSPNNDGKRDTATIRYELTDAASVAIEIADANGLIKKHLSETASSSGTYDIIWDGKDDGGAVIPDGAYSLRITAALSANPAFTQSETVSASIDATPPTITLRQPLNDTYFRTDVTVNGTISDPNLSEYTIFYSGDTSGLLDQANQSRVDYIFGDLQDLAEGTYTLRVVAKDQAENVTEKNVPFTIDRTPPKATLDTPKEGEYYGFEKNLINITGAIIERNLEIYRLRYGLGENPIQWTDLGTGSALPTQPQLFAWNVGGDQGIPDGLYTLSLYVKDKAGFEAEAKVKVTVDNTSPSAALTSPQEGGYIKGAAEIKGSAFDQNIDTYAVEFSEGTCGAAFKWAPIKTAKSAVNDGMLANWSALPLDGAYCLRLTVADKVGQKAETTVQIKVDTTPPAAPVLSAKVEDKTNADLTWSANSEPDLAGYNLYRGTQKVNTTLVTTLAYLDLNLPEGEHPYTVKAVDLAGWESTPSNEIKIKIDLTGPTVKIRSPQEGAKVSGQIDIKGTAHSQEDFKQYRIFVGEGANPLAWNLIRTSPLPIPFGSLATWETFALSEGVYSIKLEGEDLVGNISAHQITVTVDNTQPNAPLLLSATPNGADVSLTWQANTEADLAGYLLYRDDQLANATGVVVGDLKPYLLSGTSYLNHIVPDGTFRYSLLAVDQAGNISDASNSLEVRLDTHPPHLTLVAPLDQSKFQETLFARGETADLDIASVQFQYKPAQDTVWINLGTPITQAPYATYLDPVALGLVHGDYHLRGVALDQAGKTDLSPTSIAVTYTDLTPPQAPGSLSALTNGSSVALAWSANTEGDLAGYNVYRIAEEFKTKINSFLVQAPTYTDSGLVDGEYSYQVTAVDTFENESKPSNSAAAKIYAPVLDQPYTPTGQPVLQISGAGAAQSTVEIFQETSLGLSSVGSAQADAEGRFSLANIALILGENGLSARATDSAGNVSRRSDAVLVVYNEPPATPTGLTASVLGYDVSLTWNPNTEPDILGYYLYRNEAKVNGPVAVTEGEAVASFSYYFAYPWQAFDGNPFTYWMSFYYDNFTPFEPIFWEIDLPSPELIGRFEIEWGTETDSEGREILYAGRDFEIQVWTGLVWVTQKKVTGNSSKKNIFEFKPAYRTDRIRIFIADLTAPEGSKQVRINEVGIWKERPVTSASYDDLQVPDGAYAYTLSAVDQYGFESAPTAPVSVIVGDIVPPAAPSGLTAAVSGSNNVLSWSANGESDLSGYNVYRLVSQAWIKMNSSVVTSTTYTDTDLPNGVYTYRVTAVDAAGNESSPSNEASATISIALPPPPLHLTVSSPPEGGVLTATWDPATVAISGYRLYRGSLSGGPYILVNEDLLTGLSYTESGLTDGVTYYYVVVAVDAVGNESLFSNEAVGTPSDKLPPADPALFFPAAPGNSVILYKDQTDVAGFADPGTTVALSKNGLSVEETTARGSDSLESFSLNYSGDGTSLSSDGKILAYTFNEGIWLKNLETGETTEIIQKGSAPVWSPDGSRLSYEFFDRNFNRRIGLYDIQSRLSTPLTEDIDVYESRPSWSADGGKVAFITSRGGADDIWIKELATGTFVQVTNGAYPTRLKLSPDGRKIAYFVYQNLYMVDLLTGTSQEIDTATDFYSLSWSPDGREMAFISYRNGNADLYAWDLENQTIAQITTSSEGEYDVAWSPDGRQILFARWEGNGYAVRSVPFPAQEEGRILQQGLNGLDTLFWAKSGEIAFVNEGTLIRISPAGHFRFADVALDIGENLFSAAARDAAGNTSPPSLEITVVFDTVRLPDLDLSEEDLFIYPLTPVAGEKVSVGATVRNKGGVEVENVKIDLYLWDATGNLELLKSETIGSLLPGAETMITALWDSGGKIGTNTVVVIVDPNEEVDEVFEENNIATRDFIVTATEGVSMTTALDSNRYSNSRDVHISVQIANSGPAREVVGEVRVEDINGEAVTILPSFQISLAYASSRTYDFVWNTGSTYAGPYTVHTILKNLPEIIAENRTPLEILPDLNLDATVITDKVRYQSKEEVGLRVNVKNQGQNFTLSQLKVRVRILDPGGNVQFSSDRMISDLLPGALSALRETWNTGSSSPGDYQVVADIYFADQLLQSRSALFKVDPSYALTGTIMATPRVVSLDQSVAADYTVQNNGNADLNNLILRLLVVDPETETIVTTVEEVFDLRMGLPKAGQFILTTHGYSLKSYVIVLQYVRQEIQRNLARATFAVKDNTPPVIADAGADQTVNEGNLVRLDGSGSSAPSGNPLTYRWEQIAGPSVSLNLVDPIHPTFIAPEVPAGGATLTFGLIVEDGSRSSAQDVVNVTVKNVNHPPVVEAGEDQTVTEGAEVFLNGSGSFDPDGDALTYHWVQTAGPSVILSDPTAARPSFTAPFVGSAGVIVTFELTVHDGTDQATDSVQVRVEAANHPPIADAGADQTKDEGILVTLNGTGSYDPDGDILTYRWTQLGGPAVSLSDSQSGTPSFTAPLVSMGGMTLLFQLVVNDGSADSAPDQVTVTVLHRNDPPICGQAKPNAALIWPPNHKLVEITISGVTDPENDPVTLTVTGVTQDEPVNGTGDGDTSPDAAIQGGKVLLRAERSGNGNGRMYQISFMARDLDGGSCTGSVIVGVPLNSKGTVIDDGRIYDSTRP